MGRLVVALMKHKFKNEYLEMLLPDGKVILISLMIPKSNQVRLAIDADKSIIIKRKMR